MLRAFTTPSLGSLPMLLAAVLATTKLQRADAIIIRDDVSDSKYVAIPADFPAVIPFDTSKFQMTVGECAATLIDSRHAITAAHCLPRGKNANRKVPVKIAGKVYS